MSQYKVTFSAIVEAENEDQVEEIAQAIVNANLPSEVEEKLKDLHYHEEFGTPKIRITR